MTESGQDSGRGAGTPGSAPAVRMPPPPTPAVASDLFGARLPLAEQFTAILADTGVSHGLLGPREVPILWERHVLNCAVVHAAFPEGAELVDVGSGAGLPGLALAIARPDLQVHLVEPLLRRTTWLSTSIAALELTNVVVHRARAEELHGELRAPYATARAVARIDKLARWTFPLLADGGTLVALKGSSAREELADEEAVLRRLGMAQARLGEYGAGVVEPPTLTIEATVGARGTAPSARRGGKSGKPRGRRR